MPICAELWMELLCRSKEQQKKETELLLVDTDVPVSSPVIHWQMQFEQAATVSPAHWLGRIETKLNINFVVNAFVQLSTMCIDEPTKIETWPGDRKCCLIKSGKRENNKISNEKQNNQNQNIHDRTTWHYYIAAWVLRLYSDLFNLHLSWNVCLALAFGC